MIGGTVPRAALAGGLGIIAVKVALSLPRVTGQPALVAITWAAVCSFVAVGLVLFRTAVPAVNAWACLWAAAATIPGDLAEAAYAPYGLTPLGYVFEQAYLPATVALALRFPDRRLDRPGRLLVGGLWASAVGLRAVVVLTSGGLPTGFHAPAVWWTVPGAGPVHDGAMRLGLAGTALLLAAAAGTLASRVRQARGVTRESRVPVAVIGSVTAFAAAVEQTVRLSAATAPYSWAPAMVRDLAAVAIPVALLGHLLRRRAAGATIATRVVAAAQTGDDDSLLAALRSALGDPALVVHRCEAGTAPGDDRSPAPPGRRLVPVAGAGGAVLCVLDVDERSSDEELLEAAAGAVRLGIENARLHADLLAHMSELERSRARIVEAGAAERRRIERDLHDGVQQQLLAIAALLSRVGLACSQGDGADVRPTVDRARSQLQDALAELRRLARGIHPAVLSQGGLAAALPELAVLAPLPVTVRVDEPLRGRRLPEPVESTVYFVVAEALANATKHAGAAGVTVTLTATDGGAGAAGEGSGHRLVLVVRDDGRGGAVVVPGGGLAGLADRVAALRGTLTVTPARPHGTTLTATIPLPAPAPPPGRGTPAGGSLHGERATSSGRTPQDHVPVGSLP